MDTQTLNATDVYNGKIGFHAGLAADYEFMPNMAIQSGLFFTTKGANLKNTDNSNFNLMYVQIPVHFAYKIVVTPDTRIVLHAGPYAAYGVSGNIKVGDKKYDLFKDRTIELPILGPLGLRGANRFDAGLGLGVGAELGSFVVDLGWDAGLIKLHESFNRKNMSAHLSLGYNF